MSGHQNDSVPPSPSSQDLAVLIGIMAVLEGEYLSGSVDEYLMQRIGARFEREGLLTNSFEPEDVRSALNAMNYRLREARGEDR